MQVQRGVEIDIPAGVNEGLTIQIQGEGSLDKKRQVPTCVIFFMKFIGHS